MDILIWSWFCFLVFRLLIYLLCIEYNLVSDYWVFSVVRGVGDGAAINK